MIRRFFLGAFEINYVFVLAPGGDSLVAIVAKGCNNIKEEPRQG
jgi:hypothetical protein